MECPHGWVFGKDWEEKENCVECHIASWDACCDAWIDQAKDTRKRDKINRSILLSRNFDGII